MKNDSMTVNIQDECKKRMALAMQHFESTISGLRAGKASSSLVAGVKAELYGNLMPISQLSNISVTDSRTIMIQVWDHEAIKPIEKAILNSNLGLVPVTESTTIRITLPELTQERRQELSKQAKKYSEDAKIAIRNIRRDTNDEIKKLEKDKHISEDESKIAHNNVQKSTDQFIKTIEEILEEKIAQILKI